MRRVDEEAEARQGEQQVDERELEARAAAAALPVVLAGAAEGGDEAVADGDGDGRQAGGAARRGPEPVAQHAGGAVQQVPEELGPAQDEEHLVLPGPPARAGGGLDADDGGEAEHRVEGPRHGDQGHVEPRRLLARLALTPLARPPRRRQIRHLLLLLLFLGALVSGLRAPASRRDCAGARARRHVVVEYNATPQFDIIQALE